VAGLKSAFPRLQFIVTTHSPLVLAGCRSDEVMMLVHDETSGDVTAVPGQVSPMLLTMSEMYREFFGVARTFASELGESLRRYIELASNPYRSDADDLKVSQLRQHLLDNRVDLDYQPVARKTGT
jgi:predicted ATP-binding protein involved in virulence